MGDVGRKIARALLAGALMWAGLTACSAAVRGPGSADRRAAVDLQAVPAPTNPAGDPVAVLWDASDDTDYLARVDARTLETRRVLDLGRQALRVTSYSPTGRELLMVTSRGHVRVVDLRTPSDDGRFAVDAGRVVDVGWVSDGVAIVTAIAEERTSFVRIDPRRGRVLGSEEVPGTAFAFGYTSGAVVALLHDPATREDSPGPTTVAIATSGGDVASARVEEVGSGFFLPDGEDQPYTRLTPGLAVRGSQATVVGTDGTIATVELATMAVEIEGRGSLFEQMAAWFVPRSHAKTAAGTHLEAEWVAPEALLVTGYRVDVRRESEDAVTEVAEPAGAVLFDPRDWSARTVDPDATLAAPAGDMLLASHTLTPGDRQGDGIGVRAYDSGGGRAWHRFGSQLASVAYAGRRTVLVRHGWARVLVSAVDLKTGKVLATRELPGTFPPEGLIAR